MKREWHLYDPDFWTRIKSRVLDYSKFKIPPKKVPPPLTPEEIAASAKAKKPQKKPQTKSAEDKADKFGFISGTASQEKKAARAANPKADKKKK